VDSSGLPDATTQTVHGHVRAFLDVGKGPVLLLLHGIGSDSRTWEPVVDRFVQQGFRVVAPDLLGHGRSDKPRADYSIGGFANGMRDLLTVLGIERATIVGHSLGGGIAMQFAYQFPERTERVVLVDSGGLGRAVHPVLRALTLPGSGLALGVTMTRPMHALLRTAALTLRRTGLPGTTDLDEMATVHAGLRDPEARAAFLHVLRAVVDWRGQVITMVDRTYLAEAMPVCVVWGDHDTVISASHAQTACRSMPGARLEIFPGAGHFPHRQDPERFVDVVASFVAERPPARYDRRRWRRLLAHGPSEGSPDTRRGVRHG
jgi:pimeloyl-ACP methyl ester carboxylesterase